MKQLSLLLAGLLAFSACTSGINATENSLVENTIPQNATENPVKVINSAETKTLLEHEPAVEILDVRTPEEYADGHLKNARLINKNAADFDTNIKALDKSKTYLVYCAVGGRSGQAAEMMQKMGFAQVYDATEGFQALKAAGLAVE